MRVSVPSEAKPKESRASKYLFSKPSKRFLRKSFLRSDEPLRFGTGPRFMGSTFILHLAFQNRCKFTTKLHRGNFDEASIADIVWGKNPRRTSISLLIFLLGKDLWHSLSETLGFLQKKKATVNGGLLNKSLFESRMGLAEKGGRRSSGRTDDRTEVGSVDFELQSQG